MCAGSIYSTTCLKFHGPKHYNFVKIKTTVYIWSYIFTLDTDALSNHLGHSQNNLWIYNRIPLDTPFWEFNAIGQFYKHN